MWINPLLEIFQVSEDRPGAFPMDDPYIYGWPPWMIGLWLLSDSYGRVRVYYFLVPHQLPPCPRVVQNAIEFWRVLLWFWSNLDWFKLCHVSWSCRLTRYVNSFFKEMATCHFLNGSCHFADLTSRPYK